MSPSQHVEGVQHKYVVVVLGQSNHVAFGSNVEATAAADFDVGTLELADERAVQLEDSHMKAVAMAVPNQHIASVRDVNAIGVVSDPFAANATKELTILVEDHHAMALQRREKKITEKTSDNGEISNMIQYLLNKWDLSHYHQMPEVGSSPQNNKASQPYK